jgi:hypothetical protein
MGGNPLIGSLTASANRLVGWLLSSANVPYRSKNRRKFER